MASSRTVPKQIKSMQSILNEMHVSDYEPRLPNQMLEFTWKYLSEVLDDARVYSEHAAKPSIDHDDVKLAISMKLARSFTEPPPKELITQIALEKNQIALPSLKPQYGLRLPPDRYCMLQPNYRLRPGIQNRSNQQVLVEARSEYDWIQQRYQQQPATPKTAFRGPATSISASASARSGFAGYSVTPSSNAAGGQKFAGYPTPTSLSTIKTEIKEEPPLKRPKSEDLMIDEDYDAD